MANFWKQHGRWLLGIFGPIAAGTALAAMGIGGPIVFVAGIVLGVTLGALMLTDTI